MTLALPTVDVGVSIFDFLMLLLILILILMLSECRMPKEEEETEKEFKPDCHSQFTVHHIETETETDNIAKLIDKLPHSLTFSPHSSFLMPPEYPCTMYNVQKSRELVLKTQNSQVRS